MASINPFLIPGSTNGDPIRPLCPWQPESADHNDYYVDFDAAAASFEQFKNVVGDGSGLLSAGQLVVVAGQTGCGKTSMVNRCVHRVQVQLAAKSVDARVIQIGKLPEVLSVEQRISETAMIFADSVLIEDVFNSTAPLVDITKRTEYSSALYRATSKQLKEKIALLVVLPPMKLIDFREGLVSEIGQFTAFASPRIVFFMEITVPDQADWDRLRQTVTSDEIRVAVHTLSSADCIRFGLDRLNRHRQDGDYPMMTDTTLGSIVTAARPRSIKFVQRALHSVYEVRRASNDRYSSKYEVTREEFLDHVYQHLLGEQ